MKAVSKLARTSSNDTTYYFFALYFFCRILPRHVFVVVVSPVVFDLLPVASSEGVPGPGGGSQALGAAEAVPSAATQEEGQVLPLLLGYKVLQGREPLGRALLEGLDLRRDGREDLEQLHVLLRAGKGLELVDVLAGHNGAVVIVVVVVVVQVAVCQVTEGVVAAALVAAVGGGGDQVDGLDAWNNMHVWM